MRNWTDRWTAMRRRWNRHTIITTMPGGEHYKEHESEDPWDLEGYEEEAYPAEAEDHDPEWDPESDGEQYDQNHALEEDDQDIYE